jgi:isoleucyl-tRNA synthetase
MDWDHSYFTYDDNNISHIWHVLKLCHERGWLYKGHRSMPWCARCGTALSQHEMTMSDSYREMTHTSIYAKLPIEGRKGEFFLVWTTTPWTLPANVALAVQPNLDYVRAKVGDETLVLGKTVFERLRVPAAHSALASLTGEFKATQADLSLASVTEVTVIKGKALVGLRYGGPFDDLPAAAPAKAVHRVIEWDAVSEAEGTGIVHIAPGCGAEDFALSKTEKLPVLVPIDDSAHFVKGYGWLEGKEARDVAQEIADDLGKRGFLFKSAPYTHRYPVCWRCKEEIVFRVDDEWFIAMDELRPLLMAAAKDVNWVPAAAGARMQNWLENMGDWNISRKRYWGLPLPFYTCTNKHFFVLGSEEELRGRAVRGLEGLRDLHRPWIDQVVVACPTCKAESTRVKEVGDCWLDAGVVPFSTLNYLHDRANWEKWFPADFVVEMVEQVRLWFYSALFFSVVLTGKAPYRTNASHARVLAAPGEEFHKTGANMLDLGEACEEVGADIIRWLYIRQDPQSDVYWGAAPTDDITRRMLTLWNTYSFFVTYANLDAFDPNAAAVPVTERPLIDRWLLSSLARLGRDCRDALDRFDAATAAYKLEAFWEDLSTWYVRRNRRRFWQAASKMDSLSAYQTLYEALVTLARLLAPMMPFLAESIYQNLVRSARAGAEASVHHTAYPGRVRPDRRRPRAADARGDAGRRARPRGPIGRRREDEDAPAEAHRGL